MSEIRVCDTMTIADVTSLDDTANKGDQVEPQQALMCTVFRDWAQHLTIEVAGSRLSSEQFDVAFQSRTLAPDLHGVDFGPKMRVATAFERRLRLPYVVQWSQPLHRW